MDLTLLRTYLILGGQALIPIIIGSFQSLKTPETTLARRRKTAKSLGEEPEDEPFDEVLSWADSLLFPVLGSGALLSLYLIIRYFGTEWLNMALGIYFSLAGMWAVHSTFSSITEYTFRILGHKSQIYHIRVSAGLKQIFHLPISGPSLLFIPISIILSALYIPLGRPYWLSNILALCLSSSTLAVLKLDSFLTAFVLLGVLLLYDIFWVFATPVMVTVAKSIDAPIKILSPRPSSSSSAEFAMLGLGDIVVPGLVIALCLRYDLNRYASSRPTEDVDVRSRFGKSYFYMGVGSYVVGLAITIWVMQMSGKAQPALLYLSPACSLGPIFLSLIRGEFKTLWSYTEITEPKPDDDNIDSTSKTIESSKSNVDVPEQSKGETTETETLTTPIVSKEEVEDDSWMEVSTPDTRSKKKSKGKKK